MFHRLANPRDFNSVYDLYMDEYANAYLTYDPMSKEDFLSIFRELLASGTLYVVQDDVEETIATYRLVPYTARQQHTVHLGGFTIKNGSQGKGIGAQILSDIKKNCEKENKIRIELTVDVDNMRAINLYKKMGFEIEGTVRKSYRLSRTNQYYDEYLMAVLLK
jgi:RimJ/RimL family protein N-acetyltransferase